MEHQNELDLEQLAMPKGFYDEKALAEIPVMAKEYFKPDRPLVADCDGYSVTAKLINECIYEGNLIIVSGLDMAKFQKMQVERMGALFGIKDRNECRRWLDSHDEGDSEVVEALLSDALYTGKWKELPDVLQPVYHERKAMQV